MFATYVQDQFQADFAREELVKEGKLSAKKADEQQEEWEQVWCWCFVVFLISVAWYCIIVHKLATFLCFWFTKRNPESLKSFCSFLVAQLSKSWQWWNVSFDRCWNPIVASMQCAEEILLVYKALSPSWALVFVATSLSLLHGLTLFVSSGTLLHDSHPILLDWIGLELTPRLNGIVG